MPCRIEYLESSSSSSNSSASSASLQIEAEENGEHFTLVLEW